MTPSDLRALAAHADTTSNELRQLSNSEKDKGRVEDLTAAIAYITCAHAFTKFARVLAEAANAQEPHA